MVLQVLQRGFFNFFGLFIVVAFLAVGTLIIDAFSCDVELVFTCNNGGSGGGTHIPPVTNSTSTPTKGGKGGKTGTGSGGTPCTSTPNAVCGITSSGFIVGGKCNATTPPNSSCPAPVIIAEKGFYADPSLIKATNQATLHWSATNATTCSVTGGGLSLSNLGRTGSTQTAPIEAKTVFTLTCINGVGGPSSSANTTVNLIPAFQEI